MVDLRLYVTVDIYNIIEKYPISIDRIPRCGQSATVSRIFRGNVVSFCHCYYLSITFVVICVQLHKFPPIGESVSEENEKSC